MATKDITRIHQTLSEGKLKLTHHAVEEMDEDNLKIADIEAALYSGKIIEKQREKFWIKYRVYGNSSLQEKITVIGRFTEKGHF